jgi:hypothetical protein
VVGGFGATDDDDDDDDDDVVVTVLVGVGLDVGFVSDIGTTGGGRRTVTFANNITLSNHNKSTYKSNCTSESSSDCVQTK